MLTFDSLCVRILDSCADIPVELSENDVVTFPVTPLGDTASSRQLCVFGRRIITCARSLRGVNTNTIYYFSMLDNWSYHCVHVSSLCEMKFINFVEIRCKRSLAVAFSTMSKFRPNHVNCRRFAFFTASSPVSQFNK